ncbi:MAG: macrolide 2'-phosphotransferase [Fimbriimonas sp.]
MTRRDDGLLATARSHGLYFAADALETNESGADFRTAIGTDRNGVAWVLRVPRRADVLNGAEYESGVLELVRPRLQVSVPDWKIHTPELIAYPLLAGTPAASIDPEKADYDWHLDPRRPGETFLDSLAEAMVALHRIDTDVASAAGLRIQSPAETRHALSAHMDETRRMLRVPEPLWARWQRWVGDDTFWPDHTALVHGDLHPGHMLVDHDGRLVGLIDWTEAEVSDPALDFTVIPAVFGDEVLQDLLTRYARFGGITWPRMRDHIAERWAAAPIPTAMFAQRTGEQTHLDWAQSMIDMHAEG